MEDLTNLFKYCYDAEKTKIENIKKYKKSLENFISKERCGYLNDNRIVLLKPEVLVLENEEKEIYFCAQAFEYDVYAVHPISINFSFLELLEPLPFTLMDNGELSSLSYKLFDFDNINEDEPVVTF